MKTGVIIEAKYINKQKNIKTRIRSSEIQKHMTKFEIGVNKSVHVHCTLYCTG
jgi:hypothetical protein